MKIVKVGCWVGTVAMVLQLCGCSILPAEQELNTKPLLNEAYLPDYETVRVQRSTIDTSMKYHLSPKSSATESLSFAQAGVLQTVYFKKGDSVKQGDLLAQLDCTEAEDAIAGYREQLVADAMQKKHLQEQIELDLQAVKLRMEQNQALQQTSDPDALAKLQLEWDALQIEQNSIMERYEQQLQILEDAITILELRLEEAEQTLEKHRIYAPINGMVSFICTASSGDAISAGQVVIEIETADTAYLLCKEAVFEVDHIYDAQTQQGEQFQVIGLDADGESLTDRLQPLTEDIYIDQHSAVTVTIPGEIHKDVLCVREEAVYEREDGYYVYVRNEEGMSETRAVSIGITYGGLVEIVDGLQEGEDVIV